VALPVDDRAVIIFDGTCAFCEGSVRFIARHDPAGRFRFGASQSDRAREMLAEHGLVAGATGSMVLIEDGRAFLHSTATLRIARQLECPWRLAGIFLWVPRPIRDAAYRVVAAVRHRLAGRSNACEVPPPELRERMIC